jgi:hypothetical protein
MVGSCEHGDGFSYELTDTQLLKKNFSAFN